MGGSIRLAAIDLDGTLMNSDMQLSERNAQALEAVMERGILVMIATGKSPVSADLVRARVALNAPGVFTQGLVICEPDGSIRSQITLRRDLVEEVEAFCAEHGFMLLGYSGRELLSVNESSFRRRLAEHYHEPLADLVPALSAPGVSVNKLIMAVEGKFPQEGRAALAEQLGDAAHITQAVPEAIEVLPPGTSKGQGVLRLLDELGIDPAEVLAIGDAENDLEMLRSVGLPIAMGNAHAAAKAEAHHIVATNDEHGVAEALEMHILHRKQ